MHSVHLRMLSLSLSLSLSPPRSRSLQLSLSLCVYISPNTPSLPSRYVSPTPLYIYVALCLPLPPLFLNTPSLHLLPYLSLQYIAVSLHLSLSLSLSLSISISLSRSLSHAYICALNKYKYFICVVHQHARWYKANITITYWWRD